MFVVSKEFKFCAAHRIQGHLGKCRYLHGHNYVATVRVMNPTLDTLGMVIDFAELKSLVGGWIDHHWDHNTILAYDDNILKLGRIMKNAGNWESEYAMFDDRKPYVMPTPPTAENMAYELYHRAVAMLTSTGNRFNVVVLGATIEETDGAKASYSPVDAMRSQS